MTPQRELIRERLQLERDLALDAAALASEALLK
jgi:hypothetical protein